MKRYDFAVEYNGSLGSSYFDALESEEGEYVLHSEAQAEIARLQAEMERLANELEASERGSLGRKLQRDIAQVQRDRAWNDAIEAAAALVVPWEHPVGVANKILSLKRT